MKDELKNNTKEEGIKIKPQRHGDTENPMIETFSDRTIYYDEQLTERIIDTSVTNDILSKDMHPHPCPLPSRERGSIISHHP